MKLSRKSGRFFIASEDPLLCQPPASVIRSAIRHESGFLLGNIDMKQCTACKQYKDESQFCGRHRQCRTCRNVYQREWNKNHAVYQSERNTKRNKVLREKFFDMYGRKCVCCGEVIPEFLTIEHINGQKGIKNKKRGSPAWREAIQEHRPDLYEVLCWNCNLAKGLTGTCPHKLFIP